MGFDNLHGAIAKVEVHNTVKAYKEKAGRYRLEGVRCEDCGTLWFPRRFVCPKCQSQNLAPYRCAETGKVITSWVDTMGFPAIGYEDIDTRVVAMIRLDHGITEIAEIADDHLEVSAETPLEMISRAQKRDDTGNLTYGYKFKVSQ